MKPVEVEMTKFFDFARFEKGDFVWDFGCGPARRMVEPLARHGCYVVMSDKDYKGTPRDKDKVLMACVLHYNTADEKKFMLIRAHTALRKGGSIVIIEPNPLNPFFYCLYFWRWLTRSKCPRRWHNEKHMSTRLELIKMLGDAGFKRVKTKKYAWFPSKFGWLNLNEWLNRLPGIGVLNAFNWVRAER